MALEIEKNNLCINELKTSRVENVDIEGDLIVPDTKPDVVNIINCCGDINIYKKELNDGKIRIDGSLPFYIIYTGNDGKNTSYRSLYHTIDFSQVITLDNVTSEMNEISNVKVNSISCKIINERKINIKANVCFDVKVYSNSNIEFVNNVKNVNIQKMESKMNVSSLLDVGSTNVNINDKITFNSEDTLTEIFKVTREISNIETKVSYNKILTKSDLNIKIMYLTEDNRVCMTKKIFPIMGFVDMKGISEDNYCESYIVVKNITIKPEGTQDHTISISADAEIKVLAYENKEINIIQDLYSPVCNLNYEQNEIKVINNKKTFSGTYSINEKQSLNIGNEKVYDIDVNVIQKDIKCDSNLIKINAEAEFTIIHSINSFTGVSSKKISIPITYSIEGKELSNDTLVNLNYFAINQNFEILPENEISLKVDILFVAKTTNISSAKIVKNITENANKIHNKYNMIIYFTKKEDTLWNIAKKYNSTCESIIKANDLKENNLTEGTELFIPRYTC